ncbi:uncharacterized protein LOC123564271 isoform X2 [Mercenaria mercenaria]|nr:uncharacterized protein LOC123564271 isoform X2 [Mercenaria mercenaria]
MKEEGRHARDLADHYAFIVQRDNTIVPYVVKDGLRCKSVHQNSLGDSKLGVYLWRNADVQLKLAEGWKLPTCTLMVFKIVLGKCKALSQQHNDENIEPTPNFDCHIAQIQARPSDNFNVQLIRSLVYLYEYTDDCEPSVRPRQVLPYAVLTYEKAENVPSRSLNIKVDSYSKRPTPVSRPSEVDTAKSNTAQSIMNRRDPRLAQADSKSKPGDGVDASLCVPRLTLGPLPRDLQASIVSLVSDPDDPRSQLSFLASSANPAFEEYPYQPSFGPGSEEQQESSQEESEPQEPLTSLPPLKLPEQTNTQLDTRYTDPRFGYVDTSANVILNDPRLKPSDPGFVPNDPRLRSSDTNFVPNDPRLRSNDPNFVPNDPRLRLSDPLFVPNDPRLRPNNPRLQSVPLDPRLQQMSLDPRRQQRPLDPRLQQQPPDPRLNVLDPRVQQSLNQGQNVNFPVTQRSDNPQSDDTLKTRKKLTLSDYKKKVNISKPESTLELAPSTNEVDNVQEQNTLSTKMAIQTDPANYGSISLKRTDPRISDQSLPDTSIYYNQSAEQQPEPSVSVTAEEDETQGMEDDFVEEPDDMAKTLNELSDPDDISQSPKQFDEPVTEKPDADDPMLSDAMQKLVEHSGNVTLFTEALRLLQESAEQFGEQLTDPEFLVKKIAEKIDELSKLEAQKLKVSNAPSAEGSGDIHEIHSPDRIMSPDLSNDSKSDNSVPVKHIPLESVDMDVEKSLECVDMDIDEPESEPESKLDLAMQKTLQELARLEHSDSTKLHKTRKNSNKSKHKKSKKESSPDLHLLDIPIPPDPPRQAKQETQTKIQETSIEVMKENDGKKLEIKHTKKTPQTKDVEDDMKVTPILPSFKEKKKPVISINLKMNQKSNLKPKPILPENVLDIFKDDIDMRVRDRPATKDINLVKGKESSDNEKSGFGLTDKDFRNVSVKQTESGMLSADTDKNTEKNKTKVDTFDSDKLKIDESKVAKKGDERKVSDVQTVQKMSTAKFIDPFGLGSEDIDHRNISESDSQKKEVNDFGDIDWRTASDVHIADVDMRSTDTSTDNSQCSDLGDFDLRRSHSRSVSPTPSIASIASNKERTNSFKQPVRKFVDPFGLDDDTDERIISRSNSPLVSENMKISRMKEIALDSSQDSNSGSGALFDAYSVGKSKSDNIGHTSNEFGDIDWRQVAAAEMGDVDLRSVPVEKPTYSGILDQTKIAPSTAAPVIISELSTHNVDPFQQMNKNLQSMFNSGQGITQYKTSASSYDTYSTIQSKNTQSYESYTTSKTAVAGEYRTSNIPDKKYLHNYTTSDSQQKTHQEGFHNIMQNLDFSNLKNILATVKQPGADSAATASGDDRVSKKEDDDKPAFVTGLSSMNNKPGETRKLGSVYKQYQSPKKHRDVTLQQNSDPEKPVVRIPGFDVTPEKEVDEADKSAKNTNSDSKKEKTKSPSPEKLGKSKLKDKKCSDIKVSDSLPSTPKGKKLSTDIEDVMTPLPDISYQAAILESMEQSALKVRNDDSFASEMEESPIRTPKRHRSKSTKSIKDKVDRKKRRQDSDEEICSHKVVKREHDGNKTDDDDEESGLVIDLDMMSPIVKNSSDKDSPAVKTKLYTVDIMDKSDPIVDLTDDVEPVLVIDDEEGDKSDSEDLHVEDTLRAKTKDEMTNMIEKSRKNMVIKLKGETKLVNPKTGKAYNECPKGSAIEVLGQSSSSKEIPTQQIHPIHGIVSVSRGSSATAKASAGQSNSVQGQPIQAIGNSGKSSQSIKPNISTPREDTVVTGNKVYGQVPMRQTNQSTITCSSAPSVFGSAASVSNNISGINRPVPPVTLIPTVNQVQQQPQPLKYVHPFTGQTIAYGTLPQTVAMQPSVASIPRATVPMPDPQPVPQPVPPPAVLSQAPRHVLIVPGQTGQVTGSSRLPFLPTGLGQQRPGLAVQTFGTIPAQQTNKPVLVSPGQHTVSKISPGTTESNKTSTDVFDCFRDKFEKREMKKETTNIQNYEVKPSVTSEAASETKIAYSVKMFLEDIENKAKKELNAQSNVRNINTIIKGEQVVKKQNDSPQTSASSDLHNKKRPGDEESNIVSAKKMKNEFDTKTKPQCDFGSRILETLTEVKNKLRSPEKSTPSPEKPVIKPKVIELKTEVKTIKDEVKKEIESGASSELEDGEISEDSVSESEEPKKMTTGKQASRSAGASIPVLGSTPGQFNRIPTLGSWQQVLPNVGINIGKNTQPRQISTIGSNKPSAFKIGADWADIIQNPETRALERVKATNIESPSLRSISGESGDDTASLVSKSAASISKSRQKNKAQSQVKTLGEWLKLELEIDNIEPLQNIIPYALDTDLTKIPKQRKRRIRMKVKNAIEQEGTKASSFERKDTVTVEVLLSDQEAAKPINPSYSPEVSNEQTEQELKMLGTSLNFLKEKVKQQTSLSNFNTRPYQQGGQFGRFLPRSLVGSTEEKKMIVAMTLVESEMRTHLNRTCFYGYPHRRVPEELLLSTELSGFKSEAEEVFLILMVPLSAKPYHKLLQLRNNLSDMYEKRQTMRNPTDIAKIDEEIRQSHNQRQAVLRGFTGYLNKKRIQKLQETADKYTIVYDYFRAKTPPTPDSMLRFIRTTQMDLRQHLILAKQYLALEEQKMQ